LLHLLINVETSTVLLFILVIAKYILLGYEKIEFSLPNADATKSYR